MQKPHADMHICNHSIRTMFVRIQHGHITHPGTSTIAMFIGYCLRVCEVLKRQEQSVDKRLFHMSVSPTLPPSREGIGARNVTKVQFNYELATMNNKEFNGICWITCFSFIR